MMDRKLIPTRWRRAWGALGFGTVAVLLAPALAGAATISPTSGFFADDFADNGVCSLREAIEVANDDAEGGPEDSCIVVGSLGDDTVRLGPGSYVLDILGPEDDDGPPNPTNASDDLDVSTTGGSLTIEGASAAETTIDTDPAPTPWDDGVLENEANLTVRDLTLSGGSGKHGGGIFSLGTLTLERVRVTGNEAQLNGGGVFAIGPLTIKDSLIDGNAVGVPPPAFSDISGGGVAAIGPSIRISSSIIRDNTAQNPGTSPPFSGDAFGGGLFLGGNFLAPSGEASVSGSVIAGNVAGSSATAGATAGIDISLAGGGAGTVTLKGSTVSGNQGGVGGVFAGGDANDTLHVVNSTVTGNSGGIGGLAGGEELTVSVVHSTFGRNHAPGPTALFSGSGTTLNVRGTVIDTAPGSFPCGFPPGGMINSQGGNVVHNTSPLPCLTGGPGNDEEGVDPQLGPLAPKGGIAGPPGFLEAILTHRPASSSTAIDHVAAADCVDEIGNPLTIDQRGFPRPVDNDGNSVAECEAGSYELLPSPGSVPPPARVRPPATAPSPTVADKDPACDRLRKKMKRAKKKLKRAKKKLKRAKTKGQKKKVKKLRRKIRRRDC